MGKAGQILRSATWAARRLFPEDAFSRGALEMYALDPAQRSAARARTKERASARADNVVGPGKTTNAPLGGVPPGQHESTVCGVSLNVSPLISPGGHGSRTLPRTEDRRPSASSLSSLSPLPSPFSERPVFPQHTRGDKARQNECNPVSCLLSQAPFRPLQNGPSIPAGKSIDQVLAMDGSRKE